VQSGGGGYRFRWRRERRGRRERRERVHVYRMREVDRMRGVQNEGGEGGYMVLPFDSSDKVALLVSGSFLGHRKQFSI
jgi:hypothetical protein